MTLVEREMYVVRKKGTNQYKKNNGYFENIDSNGKSAIKLYETKALCESAVRGYRNYQDNFDIVKVKVSISIQEQGECL